MDLAASRPWWPLGDFDQFREALQYWIRQNWETSITVGEWWERLASAGLAAPTWNRSHGGLGATTQIQQLVEEELAAAGTIAPPVAGEGMRLIGPILRQYATPAQAADVLPALLTGQHLWTVLMYEPGSDNIEQTECAAVFDWKHVVVDGAKSCIDDTATHALLFARTAPLGGRKGLTCFLLDLATEGIVREPGVVRFEAVRLAHNDVVGVRDGGWAVAKAILPYMERSLAGRIRRGLVHVEPGIFAGNLERTVADALADHSPPDAPPVERRTR